MNIQKASEVLNERLEELASIEHERWSHWQRFMHKKCERLSDGSLVVPAELVARWERLMATPYAELSETEKESDREQVKQYLPTVAKAFAKQKI
jgi:hypothetical protein